MDAWGSGAMMKLTIQQVRNRASDNSFQRGQSYYHNGAIYDTALRGDEIEGFCQGSNARPYHVKANLSEGGIVSASCTCQYDYGGDCKHIVALLLAYIAEPESFVERPNIETSLGDRSKDELIALIGQMVKRDPDLQTLVERPVAQKDRPTPIVNTESFRRELRRAMKATGEWGDYPGVDAIHSVREAAESFAKIGDWRSASLIDRVILEEVTADTDVFQWQDEDGDMSSALDEAIADLGRCLDHLADDAATRAEIFKVILDVVIWNMDEAGRDIGLDAFDDILRHAKREDIPAIRAQIEPARDRKRRSSYSAWSVEVYESFLSDLDILDNVDPEVTLERLREQGIYNVLFEKLLALGRAEEAIAVVREHLTGIAERLAVLPRLVEAGFDDTAIQLARDLLNFNKRDDYAGHFHNNAVVEWLLARYAARGEHEESLLLQIERMKASPYIEFYRGLKATAQALNHWENIHPDLIRQLEAERQFEVLTRIYLEEEQWDAAWDTLEKMTSVPRESRWLRTAALDLEVAEASRHARPERAIPVFRKYIQQEIDQRSRPHYERAATYLKIVRDLYHKIGQVAEGDVLINEIKTNYRKLPALQDELRRVRL